MIILHVINDYLLEKKTKQIHFEPPKKKVKNKKKERI